MTPFYVLLLLVVLIVPTMVRHEKSLLHAPA